MQSKELENYIEFLLSAALQRCGNIYDAEDLTQDTLLAAMSYMARGRDIQDVKAWLLVVMGRKFNDKFLSFVIGKGFFEGKPIDFLKIFGYQSVCFYFFHFTSFRALSPIQYARKQKGLRRIVQKIIFSENIIASQPHNCNKIICRSEHPVN